MQIIPKRKIWYSFSGILIILSIAALAVWGLNLSIDFIGGSLLEVKFEAADAVKNAVKDSPSVEGLSLTAQELGLPIPSVQSSGENQKVLRFPPLNEKQHQDFITALKEKYGGVEELRFDSIGPAIGRELFQKSVVAIAIVTLVILLYIAWSFRKVSRPVPAWVYGIVVILTFLHDTIIPLGIFAWLGKFYGMEIGSPFIAAVLMILGYSINDTIVVLDRVRENIKRLKGTFEEIVEASVHQTITRSINTSLTTLLALFAIFIFGGSTLQVFSLALIVGIVFGAYSSIFIAPSLIVNWYRWKKQK